MGRLVGRRFQYISAYVVAKECEKVVKYCNHILAANMVGVAYRAGNP